MASQLLTNQSISATTTTTLLDLTGFQRPWVLLLWQFELLSGAGANVMTISAVAPANWEADSSSEVTHTLDQTAHWRGPRVVDDSMITAASGTIFRTVSEIRALFDYVKITFTFSGSGTRVFRVNLWAR